ncbi:hypothetical protein L873DRAFT_1790177 [Choiromyces venosus 120613-1]|uniref:Uncharacterized protein n=1 Tax=Choiromyces venosus 120613-1 TaxID=1336337 RepID=A0A3N4JNN3_9PEZI|nr:hypothetical protein L873DRAFT_1790177 [Choiromyces venosus 120613-1]
MELPFLTYPPTYPAHLPYILTPLSTILLVIPSYLALTRVRASLLDPFLDTVVPVRRIEGGASPWQALVQVPYGRLFWFVLKGLPIWLLVNALLYGAVGAAYLWVYGADGWVQGVMVFGMVCLVGGGVRV